MNAVDRQRLDKVTRRLDAIERYERQQSEMLGSLVDLLSDLAGMRERRDEPPAAGRHLRLVRNE